MPRDPPVTIATRFFCHTFISDPAGRLFPARYFHLMPTFTTGNRRLIFLSNPVSTRPRQPAQSIAIAVGKPTSASGESFPNWLHDLIDQQSLWSMPDQYATAR